MLLMPLGELQGIGPGSLLVPTGRDFQVPVGMTLKGACFRWSGKTIGW